MLGDQTITLRCEEATFECQVSEINDLKQHEGQPHQPFSVIFKSTDTTAHPQAVYSFMHDELGEQSLFIVPIGQTESGIQYEAVFN